MVGERAVRFEQCDVHCTRLQRLVVACCPIRAPLGAVLPARLVGGVQVMVVLVPHRLDEEACVANNPAAPSNALLWKKVVCRRVGGKPTNKKRSQSDIFNFCRLAISIMMPRTQCDITTKRANSGKWPKSLAVHDGSKALSAFRFVERERGQCIDDRWFLSHSQQK